MKPSVNAQYLDAVIKYLGVLSDEQLRAQFNGKMHICCHVRPALITSITQKQSNGKLDVWSESNGMNGSSVMEEGSAVTAEVVLDTSITSCWCSILNCFRNIRSHWGCWTNGTTRNWDGSKVDQLLINSPRCQEFISDNTIHHFYYCNPWGTNAERTMNLVCSIQLRE